MYNFVVYERMLGLIGRRSFVEVERWEKDVGISGIGEDKIIVK